MSRRPVSRSVSATRRTSGDTATIVVRAGDKDLGGITQLGPEDDDTLSGNFQNRPAFGDFSAVFLDLARALQSNDTDAVAARRAEMHDLKIEVWHSVHDMRIDEAGSLSIVNGRARFRPNSSFLMMRTGGL